MKITILTLFPEMFDGFLNTSIISRTIKKGVVEIETVNIRDFAQNKHRHVDDTPYGGGQGMVMQCQPVVDAIESVRTEGSKAYLMAPFGTQLNQKVVRDLAKEDHLILICGHYEGLDQRIENFVDGALSIGDYILTGGELASMVIADSVTRTLEGAIVEASHLDESFENDLLEYPQYTKPDTYRGIKVPDVLLSGHHKNIETWRLKESLRRTLKFRPDLLETRNMSKEEKKLFEEVLEEEQKKSH